MGGKILQNSTSVLSHKGSLVVGYVKGIDLPPIRGHYRPTPQRTPAITPRKMTPAVMDTAITHNPTSSLDLTCIATLVTGMI